MRKQDRRGAPGVAKSAEHKRHLSQAQKARADRIRRALAVAEQLDRNGVVLADETGVDQ